MFDKKILETKSSYKAFIAHYSGKQVNFLQKEVEHYSLEKLTKHKYSSLKVFILKIVNFVVKVFKRNYQKLNKLLSEQEELGRAIVFQKKVIKELPNHPCPYVIQANRIHWAATEKTFEALINDVEQDRLTQLNVALHSGIKKEIDACFLTLSEKSKKILLNLTKNIQPGVADLKNLLNAIDLIGNNPIEQLHKLYLQKRNLLLQLAEHLEKDLPSQDLMKSYQDLEEIFNVLISGIPEDRLFGTAQDPSHQPQNIFEKPIDVTMVGVEYAGIKQEGGLGEAIQGLSQGLLKQNPKNKVRLIFPKYSPLPKSIEELLKACTPSRHQSSSGEFFKVYTIDVAGVECQLIEHPAFILDPVSNSIYGGGLEMEKKRFAIFSGLAADLLASIKTDIIHLHDSHVAGVSLKLAKQHPKEWKCGIIPPTVFTFHNNQNQGRHHTSAVYEYRGTLQGLIDAGITTSESNLFASVLKQSELITTVSEQYGIECQTPERGGGISSLMREVTKNGKMIGILNGSNPDRWNPSTNTQLKEFNLNFSEHDTSPYDKKLESKQKLASLISPHFPHAKITADKPIVTYIGRYDSFQKGLDAFDLAIQSTLKAGGQFLSFGSLEDEEATKILAALEKKYMNPASPYFSPHVAIIRDYKTESGLYYYQQKHKLGPLSRAATDFIFMPSSYEPCGLVQFEGWLFGSQTIASNVGGLADSVIDRRDRPKDFNGYLFDRSKYAKTLPQAIKKALSDYSSDTKEMKNSHIKRMMAAAKNKGWHSSETETTPAEKYRLAYDQAQRFQRLRKSEIPFVDLKQAAKRVVPKAPRIAHSKEDKYHHLYYQKDVDSSILDAHYRALPEKIREQVPIPYGKGVNGNLYSLLGSHIEGNGTRFAVFAPNAKTLSLRLLNADGSFKIYHPTKDPTGCWSITIPGIKEGTLYQYVINGKVKCDPFSLEQTYKEEHAVPHFSKVTKRDFEWSDDAWLERRFQSRKSDKPMSLFEVHPTMWKKEEGKPLNIKKLAEELVKHCQECGYTHVELMGLLDHPCEKSMGYQVTQFFSANHRLGTLDEIKSLVDILHQNKIGVILDWVPAHFATDSFGLEKFDGSSLYEPSFFKGLFSLRSLVHHWGTKWFDFSKKHTREFLISSALYWLKELHIDGLRVDAVASILRSEDRQASALFLKDLNAKIHEEVPGAQTIAEDYSGDARMTRAFFKQGLGFDLKWNIGWSKSLLNYFRQPLDKRKGAYRNLIASLNSDPSHKTVLAISHDECASQGLINQAPHLTPQEKLASHKLLLSLMFTTPGHKLLFMGQDIGLQKTWSDLFGKREGMQGDFEENSEVAKQIKETLVKLQQVYQSTPALSSLETSKDTFAWIEKNDSERSFVGYRRMAKGEDTVAVFHNLSSESPKKYYVSLKPNETSIPKAIYSNAVSYALTPQYNQEGFCIGYHFTLPPLSSLIINEGTPE